MCDHSPNFFEMMSSADTEVRQSIKLTFGALVRYTRKWS